MYIHNTLTKLILPYILIVNVIIRMEKKMHLFREQKTDHQFHDNSFDIVNAFQSLDPNRQIVICDQLFHNQRSSFKNTLNLLFPKADNHDVARLEKFLRTRISH